MVTTFNKSGQLVEIFPVVELSHGAENVNPYDPESVAAWEDSRWRAFLHEATDAGFTEKQAAFMYRKYRDIAHDPKFTWSERPVGGNGY